MHFKFIEMCILSEFFSLLNVKNVELSWAWVSPYIIQCYFKILSEVLKKYNRGSNLETGIYFTLFYLTALWDHGSLQNKVCISVETAENWLLIFFSDSAYIDWNIFNNTFIVLFDFTNINHYLNGQSWQQIQYTIQLKGK